MNSDVLLDYALFQLSPRRTRCELFVSGEGKIEKLASGFFKPFVTHLKVAKEKASHAVHLIKLEVGRRKNAAWFNKGTVERFVRFVSTPEVLELVNTIDEEMSQLEGARKVYSQGAGVQFADEREIKSAAAADATTKELLRAIDVRCIAVKQDLATACGRASAAGFNLESVSELQLFADQFGAFRLGEACKKFLSLNQRRPELISHQHSLASPAINPQWKSFNDANVHSSFGSDMSIDQPEVEQSGLVRLTTSDCSDAQMCSLITQQQQQTVDEPTASSSEQLKSDPHCFLEEVAEKVEEYPAPSAVSSVEPNQRAGGGSRRMSVQDRINLFESKQKEQSTSANIGGGSSGDAILSKLAGAKGEHRRNPSDVFVEKSVLRRWSSTSDMSIDLNSNSNSNNNNDWGESESAAGTPTSSANSQLQTSSRNAENESSGLIEASKSYPVPSSKNSLIATTPTFSSSEDKDRKFPKGEIQNRDAVHREGSASISLEPPGVALEEEQVRNWAHVSGSLDRLQQGVLHDQVVSHSRTKDFSNSRVGAGSKESATSQSNSLSFLKELAKEEMMSQIPSRAAPALALLTEPNKASFLGQPADQKETDCVAEKAQAKSVTKFKAYTRKREGAKSKDTLDSQIQLKASMSKVEDASAKAGSVLPHTHGSTSYGEQREARQKTLSSPQVRSKDVSSETKQGSASQGLRLLGKTSVTDQRKFQARRDAIVPIEGSTAAEFLTSKFKGGMEATPSSSLEESRTARSNKGNHELNDVLQMKADELERLFAEHKLRIHGDQVAPTQRSKTLDDYATKSVENMPARSPTKQMAENSSLRKVSSNAVEFNSDLLLRIDDNFNFSGPQMQKIVNSMPEDLKGKLYGKYMQKRDAKLREECGSKRAQRESNMKAMNDSLELSQAEWKARFAGFSDRQNLTHVRRRAEKMRSFNSRSTPKSKDQRSESLTGDWDDDEQELHESSEGNQSKKFLLNRTLSSTSRASVSPNPKHSVKSFNFGTVMHRVQPENPVTKSVASFSDFKNENIRPSMVVSKATTQGQSRSFARSKCSIENEEIMKEDGSHQSNSTRKSSATPNQLKDLSSINYEEALNKVQISGELKQYLKKCNGAHHRSGAVMMKLRTSIMPDELKNKGKSENIVSRHEDLPDMINDDEYFDRVSAEGDNLVMDLPIPCDGEKHRPKQESEEPELENCDIRTLFHSDDSTNDSTMISSKFNPSRNSQDSPEESSASWSSQVCNSLAYTQEALDIDAFVDSLTNSPTSLNSHPLNQMMDSKAARMRKKWGNAQIPVIATSSSHQSRRDVTKGFKRLLKFGRKNKGTEYLINDWVSASTASEGDDDLEDGQDLVHRPSDDFRKSRMGYTITTYDGFNEGNIFPEHAQSLPSSIPNPPANVRLGDDHPSRSSIKAPPRSFFSLSSFRSKASDSKPR